MTKLSDTQAILLSKASTREDGSFYPLPTTLKLSGGTARALAALIAKGLAEECETSSAAATCRTDGDIRYGLFVTGAGLTAIGVNAVEDGPCDEGSGKRDALVPTAPAKGSSKKGIVLDLLHRECGATLLELIEVTGWLPHTTRAALTGIRKKGHAVERTKRGDTSCYRIVAAG